ncbi:MAG: tRNA pseudouridine(38-40) synthase TruA [Xanthomonadales bacterium]|nr:tRNA pseudouridine(38-40) synthase TruA [Xanthomonadales bacterium]ODU93027.1 MAG: tRNA pseudouridine(38-40) synthase TruA [Rhodanobacter sp. SCN 66-43]OJY83804.1 MAG: tRNA pseudouridine(38-40) synthase TruA [Xanthomonadales bacterium 66-474]
MRIALGIEYDGTDFLGWQRLAHGPSVQAEVEAALSFVADHPVAVTCAGRTDAGVHARCQVVHFDSDAERDDRAWVLGATTQLPRAIAVLWARQMPDDFHARFAARARRYRYAILNRAVRPALDARYVAWERRPLDADAMHAAAQCLVGEQDFSSFRAVSCQAAHARRSVHAVSVRRDGEHVILEIEANAFLHHMVRNIAGSLLEVGRGERPRGWIAELLAARDRELAGVTAMPQGLTFVGPRYPPQWGLPPGVTLPA